MIVADTEAQVLRAFIAGWPAAQPRVKATKKGPFVRVYTPPTADGWKTQVALTVRDLPRQTAGTLIRLDFEFERPKAHLGARGLLGSAPTLHEQKPDVDNLAKSTLDAMVDAGFLADDKIVVGLTVTKAWSTRSGCRLTVLKAKGERA